jgi:hypothetical protein
MDARHNISLPTRGDLFLAGGAEVSAAAAYYYAFDGGIAGAAGFPSAGVDVVVKLEEAGYAVGVYVVGDGGAP